MIRDYSSFDFANEQLDALEDAARRLFEVDILSWQKFRYVINSGTLRSKIGYSSDWCGPANPSIEDAYLDIGKSNTEALCSLTMALFSARQFNDRDALAFRLHSKAFYFHAGCFLDSIARIIYIMTDDYSLVKQETMEGVKVPSRRLWDWGKLSRRASGNPQELRCLHSFITAGDLDEIIRVRHVLTHSWQPPFDIDESGSIAWPLCVRQKRMFYWPHDPIERAALNTECPNWEPVSTMIQRDQKALIRFFGEVFPALETCWKAYSARHQFEITN